MLLTIHQPEHLPWLGFFHKAAQADLFVLLDNVQYRHKYFQNRNRIRSQDGECWINVPVRLKGLGHQLINDVQINTNQARWREKCWRSISLNYRKAEYFDRHAGFFETVYSRPWESLIDLNLELIRYLFGALGISTPLVLASELGASGTGPSLILDLVRKTGADTYLSGVSGIAGQGKDSEVEFNRHGIEVRYQHFLHPVYDQMYKPFIPCLSVVDLLFNHGPGSRDILMGFGVETLTAVFE